MAVDYYEIVDMIAENERAFTYFKEHVRKFMPFYCINLADVRPCDVKEKLAELDSSPEADLTYYFQTYAVFFFKLNKKLLERIKCEENSRGHAYRQRALEITEKSIDDLSLYDIEDILFIITNMMRVARKERIERLDSFLVGDLELRLNKEDYRIIDYLSYSCSINTRFEFEETRKGDAHLFAGSIYPLRRAEIYGIYGMELLTHMLMERGEFEEESVSHGGTD